MLDLEQSKTLFYQIYPNDELCEKLAAYTARHKKILRFFIWLGEHRNWSLALLRKPFFKLSLVFAYLPLVHRHYLEAGIDESIFFVTMSDIKIWIDDHFDRTGEYGLFELNWILHHMNLNIFRLGRLQFHKGSYHHTQAYRKSGITIKPGDKLLFLHIPRGERLTPEGCIESLRLGKAFFAAHFPDYPGDHFACHSWLLHSGNRAYMKEDSNILKFAAMFDVIKQSDQPEQSYLWLFGEKVSSAALLLHKQKTGSYGHTETLPCKTKLQQDAIRYINDGGTLGEGLGILILDDKSGTPLSLPPTQAPQA